MQTREQRFPRWALWISGAITFLAASILIAAIVLGVRAGQQQLEIKRQQQLSLILQQAFEFHNEGRVEAARIAYEEALLLDPTNPTAAQALGQLRGLHDGDLPQQVAVSTAVSPTDVTSQPIATSAVATIAPPTPTTPPATTQSAENKALAQANEAFAAGRWNETITALEALRASNPTYEPTAIQGLLVSAYVNLATEKDNQNKYQEALNLLDKAIALDSTASDILAERDLIENYIDAITYADADRERAIAALTTIYRREPNYRDVKSRLQQALRAQSDLLADKEEWCAAAALLTEHIAIGVTTGIVAQHDVYEAACAEGGGGGVATTRTPRADQTTVAEERAAGTSTPEAEEGTATPTRSTSSATTGTPSEGAILYSAYDATSGQSRIMSQPVGTDGAPTMLREDASQPSLRQDGVRLLYRNLRNDMAGISAWDPATGLLLRFTGYAEDSLPSWNGPGNQFVFASNREGDRIWRIYVAWAEANNDGALLSIGESPAWHPTNDLIVFRGCDNTGNRCGLWQINSSGSNRTPLTTVPTDNRPAWSPDGRSVVFMSDSRDGNFEIYRVDVNSGQVTALTEQPAADLLPTVSPDGRWVAFVSNRDGNWKIWATPLTGGNATLIAPISGSLGSWTEQSLQWVP